LTPRSGGKEWVMDEPQSAPEPIAAASPPPPEPPREREDVDEVIRWLRLLGGRFQRRSL
jgi:hypothetical protein